MNALFIDSFHKCFLGTCSVPDPVLGPRHAALSNQEKKSLSSWGFSSNGETNRSVCVCVLCVCVCKTEKDGGAQEVEMHLYEAWPGKFHVK